MTTAKYSIGRGPGGSTLFATSDGRRLRVRPGGAPVDLTPGDARRLELALGVSLSPVATPADPPPPTPAPAPETSLAADAPTVHADVGVMAVAVSAGEDGVLGTPDDVVTVRPKARRRRKE